METIIEMCEEELRIRSLRNLIYGQGSDEEWNHVRKNWMRPDSVKWLEEQGLKLNQQSLGT